MNRVFRVSISDRKIEVIANDVTDACNIVIKYLNDNTNIRPFSIYEVSKVEILSNALVQL